MVLQALDNNTTGSNNIAVGSTAGFNLTTGDFNIDIGKVGLLARLSRSASAMWKLRRAHLSLVSLRNQ